MERMEVIGESNGVDMRCRAHPNGNSDALICVTCNSLCCGDCLLTEDNVHRQHRVLKPLVARRVFEAEYAQTLQKLTKFKNELVVIRDGRFVSSTNVQKQLTRIQHDFEGRKTKIESCINELAQLLASQYSERLLQIIKRSQKPTRFEELLLREQENSLSNAIDKLSELISASANLQDVIGLRPTIQKQFKELERRQARLPSAHAEFPEFKVHIDSLDKLLNRVDTELEWFKQRLRLPLESPDNRAVASMSVDDVEALKESNNTMIRRAQSARTRSTTSLNTSRSFSSENLSSGDIFSAAEYIPVSPGCVIAKSLIESNGDLICLKRYVKYKLVHLAAQVQSKAQNGGDAATKAQDENELSENSQNSQLVPKTKTASKSAKRDYFGALQICGMTFMQLPMQHKKPLPADETFSASMFRNQVLLLCDRTNRCIKLLELDTDSVFVLSHFEDKEPLAITRMGEYCTAVMKQLDIESDDPACALLQNEQHFAAVLLDVEAAKLYFVHYEFDMQTYFDRRGDFDDPEAAESCRLDGCFRQAQVIPIEVDNLKEDLVALTLISPWSISEAYLPAKSTEKGYADSASFECYSLFVSVGGLQVLEFRMEMRATENAFSENPNEVRRSNFRFVFKKRHGTLSESLRVHAKIHSQVSTARSASRLGSSRSSHNGDPQQAEKQSDANSFDVHAVGITSVAYGAPWCKQVAVAFGDGSVRLFALDRKIIHTADRSARRYGSKVIRGTKFAAQMTMKYMYTIASKHNDVTDKDVPLRSSTLQYYMDYILRADRHKQRIDQLNATDNKVKTLTTRPINVTSWCLVPFPGIGDKLHEPIRIAIFDQISESIGMYLVHVSP